MHNAARWVATNVIGQPPRHRTSGTYRDPKQMIELISASNNKIIVTVSFATCAHDSVITCNNLSAWNNIFYVKGKGILLNEFI